MYFFVEQIRVIDVKTHHAAHYRRENASPGTVEIIGDHNVLIRPNINACKNKYGDTWMVGPSWVLAT